MKVIKIYESGVDGGPCSLEVSSPCSLRPGDVFTIGMQHIRVSDIEIIDDFFDSTAFIEARLIINDPSAGLSPSCVGKSVNMMYSTMPDQGIVIKDPTKILNFVPPNAQI